MLKSYLTKQPYTKFILIEDTLQEQGKQIFHYLVKTHIDKGQYKVQYFVFHENFPRLRSTFTNTINVCLHDLTGDVCGWDENEERKDFESSISELNGGDVVIVDSLAHAIYQYGLGETYRLINNVKNQGVQQIIALLHTDLLKEKEKICSLFEHLSTLNLNIEPKFISENRRAQYTHKKSGGKVITQIEEYKFEGTNFVTQKIEKPSVKKLLDSTQMPQADPESISTFRIGLTDEEKISRDQLVLPYLPKSETQTGKEEGKIFYEFDQRDDWDEEDPDDDLDI
ncbi:hypothetical protein NQ317_013533 [Molorchus minor]|uniref:Elongator complex protein 5 n=1 Tax=Molorchus minor TaxID=1323400 RepID=A0ABQ9JV91_9CUCU|nr:hypothetical protein NQ317_013533 [Molorchus minor]